MLYSLSLSDVFPWEACLLILNFEHLFHLNCELPNFNQFLYVVCDSDHLVLVSAHDTHLDAPGAHQLLEIFGHFLNALRVDEAVTDSYEDHLHLFVAESYR